uniref:Uncharacterized protein n=1 Tax=Romanomermis culicivorax TaxID=13658 RepID=A0A915IMT0_ROMCU
GGFGTPQGGVVLALSKKSKGGYLACGKELLLEDILYKWIPLLNGSKELED